MDETGCELHELVIGETKSVPKSVSSVPKISIAISHKKNHPPSNLRAVLGGWRKWNQRRVENQSTMMGLCFGTNVFMMLQAMM